MAVSRVLQLTLLVAFLVIVRANYRVEIQLGSYDNVRGGRCAGCGDDRGCCDRHSETSCSDNLQWQCDNYFIFCIRELNAPLASLSSETCRFDTPLTTNTSATVFDDDHLTFGVGVTALNGLPNPLVFTFDSNWTQTPDGFQLHVQVWDYDPSDDDEDEFVDRFTVNHNFVVRQESATITGRFGFGQIQQTIQVSCADNYYGGNCSTFCSVSEEESDLYTCDQNGMKICREGLNCETSPDPCSSSPCPDGASCVAMSDSVEYECICANGSIFDGDKCEREVNECAPGFTGRNCDVVIDLCRTTRPCKNGATCVSIESDGYRCLCVDGYNGTNCEVQNECIPNPCQNGGTCTNVANNYSCACGPEYTGQTCDQEVAMLGANYRVEIQLDSYDNIRGGRCAGCGDDRGCCDRHSETSCSGFRQCDNYFIFCIRELSAPLAPLNSETCSFDTPLTTNTSATVFDDDHLTFDVGATALNGLPNPLVFTFDSNWTQTPDGFQLHVQVWDYDTTSQDEFVDRFTVNHSFVVRQKSATITGELGFGQIQQTIQVSCADNYYGGNCSTFCSVSEEESGLYTCDQNGMKVCREGLNCETGPDPCSSSPCKNEATCVSIESDGYRCFCVDGYNGTNCEVQNECIPNPCQNGGTCTNVANNYSCACGPEYTGQTCDQEVAMLGDRGDGTCQTCAVAGGVIAAAVTIAIIVVIVIIVIVLLRKQKLKHGDFGGGEVTKPPQVFREGDNPTYGVVPTELHPAENEFDNPLYARAAQETNSHLYAVPEHGSVEQEFDNPLYGPAEEFSEDNNHLYAIPDEAYEHPNEAPYSNESLHARGYEVPMY